MRWFCSIACSFLVVACAAPAPPAPSAARPPVMNSAPAAPAADARELDALPSDDVEAARVVARIISTRTAGGEVQVVINAGSDKGVASRWHGVVLDGYRDTPLLGGDLVLIRIDKQVTVARTQLDLQQLTRNPRVLLAPPSR